MTRIFAARARAIEQLSTPVFSTNAVWNAGVWDGTKYDAIEGFLASNRSAAVTLYQGNISGKWDWSKTIYGNNPSSSLLVVDIGAPLRAQLAHIQIQGTSGDTPSSGYFRLVTWGKIAGAEDVSISGQSVKIWVSGAPTVLVSGPLVVKTSGEVAKVGNFIDATSGGLRIIRLEASGEVIVRFSGEVIKTYDSGAVTVLVSGPLAVNLSGQVLVISGAVTVLQSGAVTVLQSGAITVLVSGPLIVRNSGEQVQALPPDLVKVWHPFGKGTLTSTGIQYGTELSGATSTYTTIEAQIITNPTGYTMEELEMGLTMATRSTGSGFAVWHKWQASDAGINWQDLTADMVRAANASGYLDQTVAGRCMLTGNFLGTGATFQVQGQVLIAGTQSGELAYGKIKNSAYLLARYRRN